MAEKEELTKNSRKNSSEPWFDKKFARSPTGEWQAPPSKLVHESMEEPIIEEVQEETINFEEDFEFEIPDEAVGKVHEIREAEIEEDISEDIVVPHVVEPPVNLTSKSENSHKKVLNHQEIKDLSQKVYTSLKENKFNVIRKTSELGQGICQNWPVITLWLSAFINRDNKAK